MQGFKKMMWIFLMGMTVGGLMGISIKYPVKTASLEEAAKTCTEHFGAQEMKIGLTGKVYTVKCKDQKVFTFK